jgi:hypothetical protein
VREARVCSSPGYSKPAHQYGQPFGDGLSETVADGASEPLVVRDEAGNPVWNGVTGITVEEWAGKNFPLPYRETE